MYSYIASCLPIITDWALLPFPFLNTHNNDDDDEDAQNN